MMNTLFRLSESLKAVDDFRRMWRKLDESESEVIAKHAEETTAAKVRRI